MTAPDDREASILAPTEVKARPPTVGETPYACWAHDVLLVHHGLALVRYEALPVASASGPPVPSTAEHFGDRPVLLRLQLDDGRLIELVTPGPEATTAAGPFDAAHVA